MLAFERALFLFCPTGAYCREDRCQSFFKFELIPSMRAPLEECEAAGAFRKLGLPHYLIDAPAEKISDKEFLQRVIAINADLIILAVTFGSLNDDLSWVARIKEKLPRACIGIRGAPCYVWDRELLEKNAALDFCVRGDYELVFEQIALGGLPAAAGATWRDASAAIIANPAPYAEDLDALPLPDRSAIKQELYKVRGVGKSQATIRVQRGCPFPCSYCLVHTVSGSKARHRSPRSITSEICALQQSGINHFYFRAETFSLKKAWVLELCEELRENCPGANWVTTTRVECVDDEIISTMRRAGCYGISFGVDVASEKIGALVRKPPRLKEAVSAMRLCDKHGIISLAYFMIGFIWDDWQTVAETQRFIRNTRPDLLTIHFAHPYPGTKYYEAVQAQGAKVFSKRAQAEPALATEQLSERQFSAAARRMLLGHYSRPKVLWSLTSKIFKIGGYRQVAPRKSKLFLAAR